MERNEEAMRIVVALLIGTVLMLGVHLFCCRWYSLPRKTVILNAPVLTICGFAGVKLMFFIESGGWTGLSFFGAVFFVPVLYLLVSRLLKAKCSDLLDISAPSICIMLALMKVECVVTGCCKGKILYETAAGEVVRFPSQIAEMINALFLMVLLMIIMRKQKNRGRIYPWFMVLYGITRFGWNLLRETKPFVWVLPAGNFWSLIAIVIGVLWLLIDREKDMELKAFDK